MDNALTLPINGTQWPAILWGKDPLPVDRTLSSFGLIGTTRTGKTTAMRLMMQCILPGIGRVRSLSSDPPNGRAVVYDPKMDLHAALLGMGLSCPVHVMNPFAANSSGWDMAADIPDLATAQTVIERLIPTPRQSSEGSSFYHDALQVILNAIVAVLIERFPRKWTFRQLLLLAFSPAHTRAFLAVDPPQLARYEDLISNEETAKNLRATVYARLASWSLIAACWDRASQQIGFKQWRNEQSILLLGYEPTKEKPLRRLNRFLVDMLIPVCLDQTNRQMTDDRTFFFLDEFNDFEAAEKLTDLLTRGAGLGVHAVLGFQDMGGLEARHGREIARMLLGMCGNLAVFKLNNRDSANWAAEQIGKQLTWRRYVADDENTSEVKSDQSFHVAEEYLVSPDDILAMRETTLEGGMYGIFLSANTHYGVRPTFIPGADLFHQHLRPSSAEQTHFPRDPQHQILREFTPEECRRFGLTQAGRFKNRFLNEELSQLVAADF